MPYSKSISRVGRAAAAGGASVRSRRSTPGIRATRVPEPTAESTYPSATSCS